MKNEHIIWGYGDDPDGKKVLLIGLTDEGLAYLKAGEGTNKRTLLLNPPKDIIGGISQVILFHEKTKDKLKEILKKALGDISMIH